MAFSTQSETEKHIYIHLSNRLTDSDHDVCGKMHLVKFAPDDIYDIKA